jgi:hypothetical protein
VARIRSTHPGQWTSGDFLECSPLARLLALAVRNVADDHGVFRWKPTSLKAECLPADNCDIGQVVRYSVDGKEYGIIKDFNQWQRPKKPKYIHPVPDWFPTSTVLVTEPVPHPVPNSRTMKHPPSPNRYHPEPPPVRKKLRRGRR